MPKTIFSVTRPRLFQILPSDQDIFIKMGLTKAVQHESHEKFNQIKIFFIHIEAKYNILQNKSLKVEMVFGCLNFSRPAKVMFCATQCRWVVT